VSDAGLPAARPKGRTVAFDGHYGKPGHRRQRYRCDPPDGDTWHRFVPAVPRQAAVAGGAEHCERGLHTHEGPETPRESLFSARDVAYGLVEVGRGEVGRGESYRAAAASVRTHANRHPEREGGPTDSRHGQLAAEFVEVFAPVVFEPYRPTLWPEDTLVLDQVPFRVKANSDTDWVWQRLPAAVHSQHGWEQFCAAAYRHRPVLTEVRPG
jgi:hypothetical protein